MELAPKSLFLSFPLFFIQNKKAQPSKRKKCKKIKETQRWIYKNGKDPK
jgi:hypothetical protein